MAFSSAQLSTMPGLRKQRRMAREKFLKLLRFRRYVTEADMRAVFICRQCGSPVDLKAGELGLIQIDTAKTAINPKKDAFSLSCRCTVWTVSK